MLKAQDNGLRKVFRFLLEEGQLWMKKANYEFYVI